MLKIKTKIQIRPRKVGIVLLNAPAQANQQLTDIVMRQKTLSDTELKGIIGIRPFAGIRLDMSTDFNQKMAVGKLTISKEGQPLWSAHDPQTALHGLVFYPGFAINLGKHQPLEGRWQLTFSLAIIDRTRLEYGLSNAVLANLVFTEVDTFTWTVTSALLDLLPTGERKIPIKPNSEDQNQVVRLDEI